MNQKKMLDALTALRFFAASMIVLTHADPLFGSFGIAEAAPLGQGVSFFFVLSGFILTYNYPSFGSKEQFQHFFVARFARIWPLHATTCLLWIFLIFGFNHSIYFPGTAGTVKLAANLLMVQSWVPLKDWALSFDGVAWSISVELFFYICFPFIVIVWRRYWHVLLTTSAAVIVVILAIANRQHLSASDTYPGVGLLGLIYFSPVVRVFEFMVGVGLANVLRNVGEVNLSRSQWLVLEVAAIGAIFVAMVCVADVSGINHVFGEAAAYYVQRDGLWLFWAILIGVFAMTNGPIGTFLSTRPLVFLGEISFSLYLVHAIIVTYLDPYLDQLKAIGLMSFFSFWAACLALAALLFVGVERPCRGVILSWWAKRKFGAPRKLRRSFGVLEISSVGALALAFVLMSAYRPTTVLPIDASAAAAFLADATTGKESSGEFSNGVRVLGIRVQQAKGGGTAATVLMKSDRDAVLDSIIALQLNDAKGTIIGSGGDLSLDAAHGRIAADAYWIQSFSLDPVQLQKSASFAIAMYTHPSELLKVSGGTTDWGDRRLVLPIKR